MFIRCSDVSHIPEKSFLSSFPIAEEARVSSISELSDFGEFEHVSGESRFELRAKLVEGSWFFSQFSFRVRLCRPAASKASVNF